MRDTCACSFVAPGTLEESLITSIPAPQSQYTTSVLFTLNRTNCDVAKAFAGARSVTEHDPATVEVVHDVVAHSRGAAARRGVNLVTATLDAAGLQDQFSIEHTLTTPLVANDETEPATQGPLTNPVCNECGNTVAFVHHVRGTETCLYDENGTYDGSEFQQFETLELWCAECESHDVEVA